MGLRGAQRRALVAGDLPARRPARTSGRSSSASGAILAGIPAAEVDVDAFDDVLFAERAARHGVDAADVMDQTQLRGPDRIVDLTVRVSPWGDGYGARPGGLTLESLMRDHPHGVDFGPMVPRSTRSCARPRATSSSRTTTSSATSRACRHASRNPRDGLVLIGRRHVRSNNSWMHNVKVLVKGKDRCTLIVHPDDAVARRAAPTARARASPPRPGSVEAVVEVSDEIRRGVVSLPHGWGHDQPGTRLSVAREHAGTNSNLLAPGHLVDVPSGNAAVNGIPVEVVPA